MACCRPSYKVPTFNTTMGVWRQTTPRTNPPDAVVPCCLSLGERVNLAPPNLLASAVPIGGMWVQCPKGTLILDGASAAGMDVLEIPPASGCFYTANWSDRAAFAFPNEHVFIYAQKMIPFPGGGTGPPPPPPPPPPPLTPDWTWVATSPPDLGPPNASKVFSHTVPGGGSMLYVISLLGASAPGLLQVQLAATTQPAVPGSVNTRTVGGVFGEIFEVYFNPVVGGLQNLTVTDTGGFAHYWIIQAYYSTLAFTQHTPTMLLAGASQPISLSGMALTPALANVFTSNLDFQDNPSLVYPTPWMLGGTNGSASFGGFNYVQTTALIKQSIAWNPNYVMTGVGTNSGWIQSTVAHRL